MNFLKICIFLVLIVVSKIANAETKYTAKFAVVDIESVLENSLAINSIKKSINALSQNIQTDISQQEKDLRIREQELLELKKTLTEEKFEVLVTKFNKNVKNTKRSMQSRKSALEQAHLQAIEEVNKKIMFIIGEIAKEHGIDVVLPSSQVLYVTNELNLTFEVISKLNDSLKEVQINYKKFLKR